MCPDFLGCRLARWLSAGWLLGLSLCTPIINFSISFSMVLNLAFPVYADNCSFTIPHLAHHCRSYRNLLMATQAPCLLKPDVSAHISITYTLFCLPNVVHTPVAKFSM